MSFLPFATGICGLAGRVSGLPPALGAPEGEGGGGVGAGSGSGAHPFALAGAMRARLSAAAKAGPVALIDIGAAKVVCAVAVADPRRGSDSPLSGVKLLGVGINRSRGVDHGAITDLGEAERAIKAALAQAEREAGLRAYHAVGVLAGAYPRSQAIDAEIEMAGARVTEKDMAAAIAACRPPPLEEGRRVLDVSPVRWTVDGEPNIRAPLGFSGRRLGVDLHVLTVSESAVRNLAYCFSRADLEVAGFLAAPYASGLGCLTEEEREDGAAVLDLGGGAATIALFLRGAFVFADVVRLGGEQITLDLVRAFGLARAEAERLKVLEGSAVDLSAGAPPIDMSTISPGYGRGARLGRADLAAVIRPRVEEIFSHARDRLSQAGFSYLPRRRLVLTGGGAELGGLVKAAEEAFGAAVRIGRPILPVGAPNSLAGPAFSALAGLALTIANPPAPLPQAGRSKGSPGGVSGLFKWLRDSW